MKNDNVKHLLRSAAQEIESLRRQLEVANAKVEVMDLFALTLKTRTPDMGGYATIDIAYELRRAHDDIEKEESITQPRAEPTGTAGEAP